MLMIVQFNLGFDIYTSSNNKQMQTQLKLIL